MDLVNVADTKNTLPENAENRWLNSVPVACEVIEQLSRTLLVQRWCRKEKINHKEKALILMYTLFVHLWFVEQCCKKLILASNDTMAND